MDRQHISQTSSFLLLGTHTNTEIDRIIQCEGMGGGWETQIL